MLDRNKKYDTSLGLYLDDIETAGFSTEGLDEVTMEKILSFFGKNAGLMEYWWETLRGACEDAGLELFPVPVREEFSLPDLFKGATLSEGTLRLQDLAEKLHGFLYDQNVEGRPMMADYFPAIHLHEDWTWESLAQECPEHLNDYLAALEETLRTIAPEGTVFGTHPGDGALYGFWEDDETEGAITGKEPT